MENHWAGCMDWFLTKNLRIHWKLTLVLWVLAWMFHSGWLWNSKSGIGVFRANCGITLFLFIDFLFDLIGSLEHIFNLSSLSEVFRTDVIIFDDFDCLCTQLSDGIDEVFFNNVELSFDKFFVWRGDFQDFKVKLLGFFLH